MRKITQCRSGRPLGALFAVLVLALTLGVFPVLAVDDAPVIAEVEQDVEAKAILFKMADFIAQVPAFYMTIRSGYNAIQTDGQRIEFFSNVPIDCVSRLNQQFGLDCTVGSH